MFYRNKRLLCPDIGKTLIMGLKEKCVMCSINKGRLCSHLPTAKRQIPVVTSLNYKQCHNNICNLQCHQLK